MGEKVMVGMSGGVDSSVTVALLQQQGYEVCGLTLLLFPPCSVQAEAAPAPLDNASDARTVAQRLGIAHEVLSLEREFRENVMEPFVSTYAVGKTPNPCIECNRTIKFGAMLTAALERGQDKIATGHYARIAYDEESGKYVLLRAVDRSKDQSYVLYMLTQFELAHTLFPLGSMSKAQIRALAEQYCLVTAHKKDSQDICFIPDGDYARFLEEAGGLGSAEGAYLDRDGREIGRHRGHIHYTIGQRKGLGMGFGKPMYVLSKSPTDNTVTLGEEAWLFARDLQAERVNWISGKAPSSPLRVTAKTRYSQADAPATVFPQEDGRVLVTFDSPQRAVTAGQAVVFYDGELVLGGGTIL